jgi:nitroreductase
MSDFTELIMSRRSVRKYKEAQIPEESLQAILKAGIFAPNGGLHNCGISPFFKTRIR